MPLETDAELRDLLADTHTIAVLGAKADAAEDAYRIPRYLEGAGFVVFAVSPKLPPHSHAVARLADLPAPVDLIDVFRASAHLPGHVDEILALSWRPRAVWLQLGIRDDASATRLEQAGIVVVQDRCILVDHRRLFAEAQPER